MEFSGGQSTILVDSKTECRILHRLRQKQAELGSWVATWDSPKATLLEEANTLK